MSNWNRFY